MPQPTFNAALRTIILLGFLALFLLILKPFFPAIILALAFSMVFYRVTKYMQKKWHLGKGLSAFLTVLLSFFCIILPLILLISLLAKEALAFVASLDVDALSETLRTLNTQEQWNVAGYSIDLDVVKERLIGSLGSIGSYVSTSSLKIISALSNSPFHFFVFLLLYFYVLRDAKALLSIVKKLLPYPPAQQKKLFQAFQSVSRTLVHGNTLLAVIAGLIAYLGFTIFGFSGAIIWALLVGVFSFIPTLGTLLVYGVGILILGALQGVWLGILMLIYYIVAEVILRETLLQGWILEDKLKLHPILVFFALVGGVSAFGSLGLIYGPLTIIFLGTLYQFHVKGRG